MRRGEIRLCRFAPPDKRRPVLLLTRDEVLPHLREVIVAPITRTVRGLRSEVVLSTDDGMPTTCAVNFDHVGVVRKQDLGTVVARFRVERWPEAELALRIACGFAA
jgi:mRNA interferase MazF